MSVYLGTLGRLVELKCPTDQTLRPDDAYSFERTLEGRVKAQARPLSRRAWAVKIGNATPVEAGVLAALASGEWGRGPFVWVAPDAPVTNMLTPEQSTCDPSAIFNPAVTMAGPLNLGNGMWAGRSYANSTPASGFYFGGQGAPVLPGQVVTASSWLVGAGAQTRIAWYDSSGNFISSTTGSGTGIAGAATRVSHTATAPATAATALVVGVNATQGARPALTWTDQVFEWADGQGCPKAVISGLDRQLVLALRDPLYGRYADASFTITEVG